MASPWVLRLDRATCGDPAVSERREWLVTNGIGGFASGTVAGTPTRRYHGLLFAAQRLRGGRRLLCAALDAELEYDGVTYALAADRWRSGAVAPDGYVRLIAFRLDGSMPVWTYACGDALLERRVWMERAHNRTYVAHRLLRARVPARIALRAFVNDRDLHATARAGDRTMDVTASDGELRVVPAPGATPIVLRADRGTVTAEHIWYRDYEYALERERGLDDVEDHLRAGTFVAPLGRGETLTVAIADHDVDAPDAAVALARARAHDRSALTAWTGAFGERAERAPDWVARLVLAADQFVVACEDADGTAATGVIAGYPWFGEWSRDTAIALPGLLLATGRTRAAGDVLRRLAALVDGGMLPNIVPDAGGAAAYNSVDAPLWFIEAVRRIVRCAGDFATLHDVFPAVRSIVEAYTNGARFGIGVDPADGLLRCGEPGVQLTWMDAKVDGWVVTPRTGKPVEINALWLNALRACAVFAALLGEDAQPFAAAAARAREGFERFWCAEHGWCYDVIDGPVGDDASLRPNQLFAVSLPIDVLDAARRQAIVDVCASRLWTPAGLRTLAADDPRYRGVYAGDARARDGAYHQGTVWTWLAGPFAIAHARVHDDREGAIELLQTCADGLTADAIGTLGEIADGDAPFAPRGAFAQAWSVATMLDAWTALS